MVRLRDKKQETVISEPQVDKSKENAKRIFDKMRAAILYRDEKNFPTVALYLTEAKTIYSSFTSSEKRDYSWAYPNTYKLMGLDEKHWRQDLVNASMKEMDKSDSINAAVGDRIELISITDPYSELKTGDIGTVEMINDIGTIYVIWDRGIETNIIPGEDVFKLVEQPKTEDMDILWSDALTVYIKYIDEIIKSFESGKTEMEHPIPFYRAKASGAYEVLKIINLHNKALHMNFPSISKIEIPGAIDAKDIKDAKKELGDIKKLISKREYEVIIYKDGIKHKWKVNAIDDLDARQKIMSKNPNSEIVKSFRGDK